MHRLERLSRAPATAGLFRPRPLSRPNAHSSPEKRQPQIVETLILSKSTALSMCLHKTPILVTVHFSLRVCGEATCLCFRPPTGGALGTAQGIGGDASALAFRGRVHHTCGRVRVPNHNHCRPSSASPPASPRGARRNRCLHGIGSTMKDVPNRGASAPIADNQAHGNVNERCVMRRCSR